MSQESWALLATIAGFNLAIHLCNIRLTKETMLPF